MPDDAYVNCNVLSVNCKGSNNNIVQLRRNRRRRRILPVQLALNDILLIPPHRKKEKALQIQR